MFIYRNFISLGKVKTIEMYVSVLLNNHYIDKYIIFLIYLSVIIATPLFKKSLLLVCSYFYLRKKKIYRNVQSPTNNIISQTELLTTVECSRRNKVD